MSKRRQQELASFRQEIKNHHVDIALMERGMDELSPVGKRLAIEYIGRKRKTIAQLERELAS